MSNVYEETDELHTRLGHSPLMQVLGTSSEHSLIGAANVKAEDKFDAEFFKEVKSTKGESDQSGQEVH